MGQMYAPRSVRVTVRFCFDYKYNYKYKYKLLNYKRVCDEYKLS